MRCKSLRNRILILSSVFVLLSSLNTCAFENAFASPHRQAQKQTQSGVSSHHYPDYADRHSHEGTNEEEGPDDCCSALIAIGNSSSLASHFELIQNNFYRSEAIVSQESIAANPNIRPKYEIKFSPGESPPTFFLSTFTSHAPPAVL